MKTTFTPDQFTPTKFSTAADKAKFANQFVKLVESNFKRTNFPKWFYQQLSMTRGHIAHFNQCGFFANWFEQPHQKVLFVEKWTEDPIYGDPQYTYSDVEKALAEWLINDNRLSRQKQIMHGELKILKLADNAPDPLSGLTSLDFKVLAKSKNTNSFGLNQYVMVAANGLAYQVHRTCSFPWQQDQIVTVPLRAELRPGGHHRMRPAWEQVSVECPAQLPTPNGEILSQIWPESKVA